MKLKYFWFDLDGALRKTKDGKNFVNSPENQEPYPGTQQAVRMLSKAGFRVVGIHNQSRLWARFNKAHGIIKSIDNAIVQEQVTLKLFPEIEKIMMAPTYTEKDYCYEVTKDSAVFMPAPIGNIGNCATGIISCRKPSHGIILNSVQKDLNQVDWKNSWMVGDEDEDQLCASAAGANFIWADVFRSFFCSEIVELPQQNTKMIQKFELLLKNMGVIQ